jgi:excisionase family DNA binding protein
MDKDYLTIFEVAGITKYTVGTLRKLVLRNQIPFHKIRRSLRFRRGELALWIQSGGKEVVYLPDDDGAKPETEQKTGEAVSAGVEVSPPPEVTA